jgi:hypothetical protein
MVIDDQGATELTVVIETTLFCQDLTTEKLYFAARELRLVPGVTATT